MRLILTGAMALACSAADPAPQARAKTCSKTERNGTYLMTLTVVSGDCGEYPQQLGRLDDAEAIPDICALDAPDRWSEGECKFERAYTCLEEGIGPGVQSHWVAVTTQDDDSGSRLSGTVSVRITSAAGLQVCVGTYSMSAVRQ